MSRIQIPHTHRAITKEDLTITQFGTTFLVPAGTQCLKLHSGSSPWLVDDLSWIKDKTTLAYHDAYYRGIRIEEKDLENIVEV